jgi:hypothetical protein
MPWSGSRARSRDRGHADAMRDVFELVRDVMKARAEDGTLHPEAAFVLDAVASYAFDAWLLGVEPKMTPDGLRRWADWSRSEPPVHP